MSRNEDAARYRWTARRAVWTVLGLLMLFGAVRATESGDVVNALVCAATLAVCIYGWRTNHA
jgi:hypothetical protein